MRHKDKPNFPCMDCEINTLAVSEYYMVKSPVWRQVVPDGRGFLCIGCLETRLGRQLTLTDFTDAPVNDPECLQCGPRSDRFLDRLGVNT